MREANLLRLVQSFVVSHISYVGAFHKWRRHERDRINAAIRKAYKAALGLLGSTSNDALARLGVHNTLEEISEAQRTAQLNRLATTNAGREILRKIGLRPPQAESYGLETPAHERINKEVVRKLVILPLPRNVHPERNEERRRARAKVLIETHADDSQASSLCRRSQTPLQTGYICTGNYPGNGRPDDQRVQHTCHVGGAGGGSRHRLGSQMPTGSNHDTQRFSLSHHPLQQRVHWSPGCQDTTQCQNHHHTPKMVSSPHGDRLWTLRQP